MLDPAGISGLSAAASALNEKALVANACGALSAGVVMNRPPSASSGANAIACSAPSTPPQRSRRSAASASRSSGLLTSSSSTSTGLGQPLRRALGQPAHAAEARQQDLRALLLRPLGGVERDRVLGDDAGDQQALAVEDHRAAVRAPHGSAQRPREPLARLRRARRSRRRSRRPPRPRRAGARRRRRRPAARARPRRRRQRAARAGGRSRPPRGRLMIPSSAAGQASTRSAPRSREFIVM